MTSQPPTNHDDSTTPNPTPTPPPPNPLPPHTQNELTALQQANTLNTNLLESDHERSYIELTQNHSLLQQTCTKQQTQITSLTDTVTELQSRLNERERNLADAVRGLGMEKRVREELEVEGSGCKERMARMEVEADSLFQQISRLTNDNTSLNTQLTELQTSTTLTTTSTPSLRYETLRLKSELESLSSHSKWLESELHTRSSQMSQLRLERATTERELSRQIEELMLEKEETIADGTRWKNRLDGTVRKLDRAELELRESEREKADVVHELRTEINAERDLVSLHKENSARMEERYNDTVREIESLRRLAEVAVVEHTRDIERVREEVERDGRDAVEECRRESQREVQEMKERLRIVMEEKTKLEDDFMSGAARRKTPTRNNLPALTNGGVADRRGDDGDLPLVRCTEDGRSLSLTDVYDRLAEAEEEARNERAERRRTELLLERIQREIEATVPKRRQERREYENSVRQVQTMQERLRDALEESQALKSDLNEMQHEGIQTDRECRELRLENEDLARQVQALLQKSLGGGNDDVFMSNEGDDIVTFGSAEELQNQNQRLLREHHRLTEQISELEEKLNTETVHVRLKDAEGTLKGLLEERENQATLVSSIVQQRDLYRALLAKNDAQLLDSTETESTALVVKNQDDKLAQVEQENAALEESVAKLKSELSTEINAKKGLEERLLRLDAHTEDLTESIKTQRRELSEAQAATARSQAELSYTQQVAGRLEESLAVAKKEVERLGENKRDLQRVNDDLQSALSASKAEVTKQEEDLRQSTVQLNLSETRVLSLQAAESRLAVENNTLRSEMARHTALHESMQKIEASISSRADGERERLSEDVKRLDALLSSERTKHKVEIETMQNRIADVDIRANVLEKKGDEANTVSIAAKNDAIAAKSEVLSLKEKCKSLEEALSAATAKLGDTDMSDHDKLSAMTTDLEAARADLAAAKKQVEDFRNIAKANEGALADSMKANEDLKVKLTAQLETMEAERNRAQLTAQLKQEALEELSQNLNSRETEQGKIIQDLKEKSETLTTEVKTLKDDKESMTHQLVSLSKEITTCRTDAASATDNYERELMLHSEARTALRNSRLETEKENRLRQNLETQLEEIKAEVSAEKNTWDEEKTALGNNEKAAIARLEEFQEQNKLLHSQLSALAETIEKDQNERSASLSEVTESTTENANDQKGTENISLQKQVSELREIVRFMRSERETLDSQLLSARRSTERERAAADVLKRSLEDSRAEITIIQKGGSDGIDHSDKVEKLQATLKQNEEQLLLMKESNQLLREEGDKLSKSVSKLEKDLNDIKAEFEPTAKKCRDLEIDKAANEAEKSSLAREVEAWKDRVKSLVSKFNQIDPEEHSKALAKVEETEKECTALKAAKEQACKETSRAKTLIIGLNKEIAKQKGITESTKAALEKMSRKSADAAAALKELEDVKKMKSSVDIELQGYKGRVERLTGMLRGNKEIYRETKQKLLESVEREKEIKANLEKEEESKKLLEKEMERLKMLKGPMSKDNTPQIATTDTSKSTQPPATKGVTKSPTPSSVCERPSAETPADLTSKDGNTENDPKMLTVPSEGFKFAPSIIKFPESSSLSVKNKLTRSKGATESEESDKAAIENPVETSDKEASLSSSAKLPQNTISTSAVISPNELPSQNTDQVGKSSNVPLEKANILLKPTVSKEDALRQKIMNKKRLLEQKLKGKVTSPINDKRPAKRERVDSVTTSGTAQDESGSSESIINKPLQASSDAGTKIQDSLPTVDETQELKTDVKKPMPISRTNNTPPPIAVTEKRTEALPQGSAVFGSALNGSGTENTSSQTSGDSKKSPSETTTSISGPFLNLKPPGSGPSTPFVFGKSSNTPESSSGAFLNLKPPGPGQSKPLVFGKSTNITLPTPSKNANPSLESMKQQPFGTFGVQKQDGSASFGSTGFGAFASSGNPKLSFDGLVNKKRMHQDDKNEVPTTKVARVEEGDTKKEGEREEDSGESKTEVADV